MTGQRRIRLFLNSNVLTGGIVSTWGLDKATLSLCAAKVCRLVLADVVRDDVEDNLLLHAERLPALDADQLIEDYRHLIKLTSREIVPYPDKDLVHLNRHFIRHAADVPVLLSAMASKPDWLLTHNTGTSQVPLLNGRRCALPPQQSSFGPYRRYSAERKDSVTFARVPFLATVNGMSLSMAPQSQYRL